MLDDFFGQLLPLRLGVIEQGHLEHPQSAPIQIHFIARVVDGLIKADFSVDDSGPHLSRLCELMIPDDCLKLGDYAVVVKDVAGFIERMRAGAIAKGYRFARRVVNYYDPETFHGSFGDLNHDIEPVFWKQKRHGYQREFRFVIDSGSLSDCPLVLEIGDLSDITWQLGAVETKRTGVLGWGHGISGTKVTLRTELSRD